MRTRAPSRLLAALFVVALARLGARAQTCANYAQTLSDGTCACPPGLAGSACSRPACGDALTPVSERPVLDLEAASSSSAISGCDAAGQCTDGWAGPTCNVCIRDSACSAGTTSDSSLTPGATALDGEVICNTGAWAWTQQFLSCDVVNPTLQAAFAGQTRLTISKSPSPANSIAPTFGDAGSTLAQLWYTASEGNTTVEEQFYCSADSCEQSNTTTTNQFEWACSNLACTCIPGTMFCGGSPLDLTTTINELDGGLTIACDADGSGQCSFVQSTLQTLFGQNGLGLSGCTFGECVSTATIASLSADGGSGTVANESDSLSAGVIAGLAVLAAFVLFALALLVWGLFAQRRARRRTPPSSLSSNDKQVALSAVGLRFTDVSYSLSMRSDVLAKAIDHMRGVRTTSSKAAPPPTPVTPSEEGQAAASKKRERLVLDGISGEVAPGSMLAILGPSGSGKSTLLDVLARKRKRGRIGGSVTAIAPHGASASVGYVDQNDVLPATSTVREALMFAAQLKLGEAVTKREKEERVYEIIELLGLREVADSMIGSDQRRGISGGERRRVSIGIELVAVPAILLADEPTSGLDAVSAMRVVQALKTLTSSAVGGRKTTVVCAIHQPSSRIFQSFDSVLLLGAGGRQLYCGSVTAVPAVLESSGRPCPKGWNVADYMLELASDKSSKPLNESVSHESASSQDESYKSETDEVVVSSQGKPASVLLTQFEVLALRELRNMRRDWTLVIMHVAVAAIVGVFVGGLYFNTDESIGGFQSRVGSLFFLGSLLAFSSLSALSNFLGVRTLFVRERSGGLYSPSAFLLSRVVFDIVPLRIVPTIIVSVIVYWMVGLAPSAARFFKYLLILVEYTSWASLFNLFLAAMIEDSGIAILLSAVLNLFQMAYAGFFVNLASIPPVLRWLQWLSPLKYTLEALAVNEVGSGLMIRDTLQGVPVEIGAFVIMQTLFGFEADAYYRDVLVLVAWIAGFAALLVAAVWLKLRELR